MFDYRLDPFHYFSSPALSWDAMFKMTGINPHVLILYWQIVLVVSKIGIPLKKESDFHKLIFTVLKQDFTNQKPTKVIHGQYKNYHNDYFRTELGKPVAKILLQ